MRPIVILFAGRRELISLSWSADTVQLTDNIARTHGFIASHSDATHAQVQVHCEYSSEPLYIMSTGQQLIN